MSDSDSDYEVTLCPEKIRHIATNQLAYIRHMPTIPHFVS
jgi:hypothetical protein